MPLSHFGCSDRLNWHYTQDGIYSVKSGYLVAQEMNMNGELGRRGQSSCDATKDTIWGFPLSYAILSGRGVNVLVVQNILRRRGIRLETYCPLCEDEDETQVHLFFRCPFARVFWFSSRLQLDVGTVEGGDFLQCWKGLCNKYGGEKESDQLLRWIVCGLWRIWKCRNSAVFEKVVCEPRVALDLLHQQWREIKDSRWDNEQHHCRQQVVEGETHRRWVKPPFCTIKFDGGSESNEIGTDGLCGKGIRVCLVGDGFEGLGGDAKWSLGSGGSNGGYPMGYSPYSTTIEFC
ncbi:uncharacterized protein LOC125480616 [Pyrus x bretschneideri]|uniref:uncharacterized protein LOC125480616 n=1 Tax=Pyrus x bretschneideri TaxID=225117 RepID=UPI0020309A22|nr:uncharacterized protein LOC125480616 [Pyrus x bretschneideri]